MNVFKVKDHLSEEELQIQMGQTKNIKQFKRWQIIYLAKTTKLNGETISKVVNTSKSNVHTIVDKYNKEGPEALLLKKCGGRKESCAYMTLDEEAALLKELEEDGTKGLIITVKKIKKKAEEKLGHPVSKDYPYDLLNRHGWRKVKPRPVHPKKDPEEQEEFKKNFIL